MGPIPARLRASIRRYEFNQDLTIRRHLGSSSRPPDVVVGKGPIDQRQTLVKTQFRMTDFTKAPRGGCGDVRVRRSAGLSDVLLSARGLHGALLLRLMRP
jgi:hypothetical protein